MWLMTKSGFFSVVEHRDDQGTVLIRARCREDLENLVGVAENVRRQGAGAASGFYDDEILRDDSADYRWRLIVARESWREVVDQLTNLRLDMLAS